MSEIPEGEARALAAVEAAGIPYAVTRHGRVGSLAEAAAARGVEPDDIIKTLVVRRADDDFLFVLVPGGRTFSWPKLRSLLGENRLSMPDAAGALTQPTTPDTTTIARAAATRTAGLRHRHRR